MHLSLTIDSGSSLGWSSAQQKYSLNNLQMLSWLGLIRCIPRTWRSKLTSLQNDKCETVENHAKNKSLSKTSKIAYQKSLKPLLRPLTAQISLRQPLNLSNVNWSKIYFLPRVTTIESSISLVFNNSIDLSRVA